VINVGKQQAMERAFRQLLGDDTFRRRVTAVLLEESHGRATCADYGNVTEWLRRFFPANRFLILVHVRGGTATNHATSLEAVRRGADGIWSAFIPSAAESGYSSSFEYLDNLMLEGNTQAWDSFMLEQAMDVAKHMYYLNYNTVRIPDSFPILGQQDRAWRRRVEQQYSCWSLNEYIAHKKEWEEANVLEQGIPPSDVQDLADPQFRIAPLVSDARIISSRASELRLLSRLTVGERLGMGERMRDVMLACQVAGLRLNWNQPDNLQLLVEAFTGMPIPGGSLRPAEALLADSVGRDVAEPTSPTPLTYPRIPAAAVAAPLARHVAEAASPTPVGSMRPAEALVVDTFSRYVAEVASPAPLGYFRTPAAPIGYTLARLVAEVAPSRPAVNPQSSAASSTDFYVIPSTLSPQTVVDNITDIIDCLGNSSDRERVVRVLPCILQGRAERTAFCERGGILLLVRLLVEGSAVAKEDAVNSLQVLCRDDKRNSVAIREAGGIPPLIAMLANGSPSAKEKAAGALWSLAKSDDDSKLAISSHSTVEHLVKLLSEGTPAQQENAAGAIVELGAHDKGRALLRAAGIFAPLQTLAANMAPKGGSRKRLAECALRQFNSTAVRHKKRPEVSVAGAVAMRHSRAFAI